MLIGVVGFNGSGKDTVAEYLVTNHNFVHKDLGQEIRTELRAAGKDHLDRTHMIALGNERRQKFGANYWCKRAIDSTSSHKLILTSIRNPSEVDEIKSRGGTVIEIFADQQTRFNRTIERRKKDVNVHGDVESFEHFKSKEEIEMKSEDPTKQQLLKCASMAEYKLDNNSTYDSLYTQIESLLSKLKSSKK